MRAFVGLLALSLGGCAQILGADDPVTPTPVPPEIESDYLFALSVQDSVTDTLQYQVTLSVDDFDARTVTLHFVALDHTSRAQLTDSAGDTAATLANLANLGFTIDPFQLFVPVAATSGGQALEFTGTLTAHFPEINSVTSHDVFCGTFSGTLEAPTHGGLEGTFAAVKIESGSLPAPKVSCADVGGL